MKTLHRTTPGLAMLSMLLSLGLAACSYFSAPATGSSDVGVDGGHLDAALPDAALPDAAQPDAAQPDDGQLDDGQPGDGQPGDALLPDAQPDDGLPDDGQPGDGQLDDGQPGDALLPDGQLDDGQPGDALLPDGPLDDGQPSDTEPLDVSDLDADVASGDTPDGDTGFGPNLLSNGDFSTGSYAPWYPHRGESTLAIEDGALRISYGTAANQYAECELAGLEVGAWYRVSMFVVDAVTNQMETRINGSANDHDSMQVEWGYGVGLQEHYFQASAETLYLAVGDNGGVPSVTYIIIDDVSVQRAYDYSEVQVEVLPSSVTLAPGATQQFTATVTGASDSSVTWTVDEADCGTISTAGLYTAPATTKTCHVRATSVESSSASAVASVSIAATAENPNLEPVDIPTYDSNDPTHCLIPDDAPWAASTLNNPAYQHFYVRPGDYTGLERPVITVSGTEANRKTISLYNGNDLHPGQMEESELAQVMITWQNADYWTVDRMAGLGYHNYQLMFVHSEHNIVNRFYTAQNHAYPIIIRTGSHYTTVQNSRFENMVNSDAVSVNLTSWGESDYEEADGTKHFQILHCKVVRNEFVNQNDGVQATVTPPVHGPIGTGVYEYGNIGGLLVDDNDFYLTDDADYAQYENALDLKCGSPDPRPDSAHNNPTDNPYYPVVFSNNRAWGYVGKTSESSGGGGTSPFITSMHANGCKIFNNLSIENSGAFSSGGNSYNSGIYWGFVDSEIHNNITYRCGAVGSNKTFYPFALQSMKNTDCYNNYIIEPQLEDVGFFVQNIDGSKFRDTKIVDPYGGNYNFVTDASTANSPEFISSLASTTVVPRDDFTDYVFTKDKFTNHPTVVTLPKILDPNGAIVSPQ